MGNFARVLKELRKEQKQLKRLRDAIASLAKIVEPGANGNKRTGKRPRLSVAARKKIAAAQRARWARVRREKKAA
jgi:hypothetical protein